MLVILITFIFGLLDGKKLDKIKYRKVYILYRIWEFREIWEICGE